MVSLIQHFEALKILNSGIFLKTFTHGLVARKNVFGVWDQDSIQPTKLPRLHNVQISKNFERKSVNTFLTHQLKHIFLVLKKNPLIETVLLNTHNMFCLRNKNNNFSFPTFIWQPEISYDM